MDEQNQKQNNLGDQLINILLPDGLNNGLVTIAQALMNAAMLIEREQHLGVAPHQRSSERDGYANGFKPRSFHTTFGNLDLAIPQVRDSSEIFRTSLLEKGSCSDRALKSAIATMYVQGVSTRRVTKVVEELCGFEVSSGQVSNLTKQLDEEFKKWRTRPLEEMRTSNSCENLNNQIKRRTRVVGVFPSEDSLERLVTGVLTEISESWETGRAYLKIEKN